MSIVSWFERSEITSSLWKRIDGFLAGYRQNVALLGPPDVGKTALLNRLLLEKCVPSLPLISVYIDFRTGETFAEWAARFIEAVVSAVVRVKCAGMPGGGDPVGLFQRSTEWIPHSAQVAQRLLVKLDEQKANDLFGKVWDVPQQVSRETGLPCLLVLDEFHRMDQWGIKEPFRQLGHKIMVQSSTLYVAASSQSQAARAILREGLNLLFGQFEVVEVNPLEPAASLKAIRSVWTDGPMEPFLEHLIMQLAQGYPGYLDPILEGLLDKGSRELAENQERAVLDVLESLMLDGRGILRQHFENRLRALPPHPGRRGWLQVLAAVACGFHRTAQIAVAVERSSSYVGKALKILEQHGFVLKNGGFYRVPDRLFRLWLLTAYPILQGAAFSDSVHARAHFRDSLWMWIKKVRETIDRPLEGQVKELLRRWSGELCEVEGKRIVLPKMCRVESVAGIVPATAFIAHQESQADKSWLVIPWLGSLQEGHARAVAEGVGKIPFKYHKKVLIGAHSVEVNARIILQEHQIRIWDLDVLSDLLDLYGLSRLSLPSHAAFSLAPSTPIHAQGRLMETEDQHPFHVNRDQAVS
ncbi:MAG: hypothetical protein NC910_02275 [Candidatus Omnitrophica bacterium]|nr:hypothetical protein [Candidatus Omnitrophota bacterium]